MNPIILGIYHAAMQAAEDKCYAKCDRCDGLAMEKTDAVEEWMKLGYKILCEECDPK